MLNSETVKKNYETALINEYWNAINQGQYDKAKEINDEYKKLTGKHL